LLAWASLGATHYFSLQSVYQIIFMDLGLSIDSAFQ